MIFKFVADTGQLLVYLGPLLLEGLQVLVAFVLGGFIQRGRGADARDHVFALRIDQPFAVKLVHARCGIARERHARRGGFAQVAEHHRLHINRRAPFMGNAFNTAVGNGALTVPGLEYGLDAAPELLFRIIREGFADILFDNGLEFFAQIFELIRAERRVFTDALGFLYLFHGVFEFEADPFAIGRFQARGLFHDYVRVHHNQASVRVIGETGIAALLDQARQGLGTQPDIEHRVHHARHRHARAGTHGKEQRVFHIPVLLLHDLFNFGHGLLDFGGQLFGQLAFILVIGRTHLRGNGKARRHRNLQACHFREVGAFAAQ
ncbi:MAG: hypothetical protein BWY09_02898 [Candidatus Hydrogenedentes bacterium ADurb.Bin179]|nr:MAG: hypothetical protein BWY09_02898 [Candidatus Hydrogenedentes bacterium ADurb.Bin179]